MGGMTEGAIASNEAGCDYLGLAIYNIHNFRKYSEKMAFLLPGI